MEEGARGARAAGDVAPKLRARRQPKPPDLTPGGFPYFLEFDGEAPPPFKLLCRNYYRYRSHAEVAPDDIPVCHCTPPPPMAAATGPSGSSQEPGRASGGPGTSHQTLQKGEEAGSVEGAREGGGGVPVRRGCNLDTCLNAVLSTECTPGHCPTGEACQNQRFQRCEYKRVHVRKVEGRGWGMIAAENIEAGAFVMEYCGEVVPIEVAARRLEAYERAGEKNVYTLELSSAECIDPTLMGAPARFINHSCDPNCETRKWTVLGEVRVGVFTRRPVPAGTELTYDYNFQWYGGDKVRCRCGAANCVGFLGAKSRGFQQEFEEHTEEEAVPWHAYDDLFDVEQIPTYDSSSEDEEQKGAALAQWAAYRGMAQEGASESSEEREGGGKGEGGLGYEVGSGEERSPESFAHPNEGESPLGPSGGPRKGRRAAADRLGVAGSLTFSQTGRQGGLLGAVKDEAADGSEDVPFQDAWEGLEDAPDEEEEEEEGAGGEEEGGGEGAEGGVEGGVEGRGGGGVALASVADMMDRKRRSSRRQASARECSETGEGRGRTRKAGSSTGKKGREEKEKEKPSAAKAEEGISWLNPVATEQGRKRIRDLGCPPLAPEARESLLERAVKLQQAQDSFLQLRGPVEEEARRRSSRDAGVESMVLRPAVGMESTVPRPGTGLDLVPRPGAGLESGVPRVDTGLSSGVPSPGVGPESGVHHPGTSGESLQEQLREAWLDGLECALDLRCDLIAALSRAQQQGQHQQEQYHLPSQPPRLLAPDSHSSMLVSAQGTPA